MGKRHLTPQEIMAQCKANGRPNTVDGNGNHMCLRDYEERGIQRAENLKDY